LIITNKDILKVIGVKIKEARNTKKFTQEYVAEKIDKSPDIIRNIENGRSVGSVETLLNICNLLDITLDDIFNDLLKNKNTILDRNLYKNFQELDLKEKELINMLITYIKNNR
jgi:transcriptional regulator with XRE-family HTH domain